MLKNIFKRPAGESGAHGHVAAARDWEEDRVALLEQSEARAWGMVRVMAVTTVLAVASLAVMVPFYKVIPVVFQEDRASGEIMQAVIDPKTVNAGEYTKKNYLATYVSQRERYHWTLLNDDYDTVMQLSDEGVAKGYKAIYEGPDALDKRLGENTDIRVKIISVEMSPTDPNESTVRWERQTRRNNQDVGSTERFSSSISFKFTPPATFSREKALIANPFGFKVTGYAVASVMVKEGKK